MDVRTAVVFGASGFTGRAIVRRFLRDGIRVVALVRRHPDLEPSPLLAIRTVQNPADLGAVFAEETIDLAIHLAAPSGVVAPDGIADACAAAVTSLATLMDAARRHGTARVITTGSYWQYAADGSRAPAATLYAALKNAAAEVAAHFARDIDVVETVLFDSYGPGDERGKIFSLVRDAALSGTPLALTPGEQTMLPIHIDDVAEAFSAAARLPAAPGLRRHWAPGPERMTLRAAVEAFCEATGLAPDLRWSARSYPEHQIFEPHVGEPVPGWTARIPFAAGARTLRETQSCP